MLCVNARKWGLIISLTRFVQFGKVPDELRKKYEDNVYIDCVLMANTKPGKPVVEAFKKGLEAYKKMGYPEEYQLHHQGELSVILEGIIKLISRLQRLCRKTRDLPGIHL